MATLDNILGLLNKWPMWKRMTEAPDRVDKLQARVAALEDKLERAPGEACPSCGALEYRVESTKKPRALGSLGARVHVKECGECGFEDEHFVTPD